MFPLLPHFLFKPGSKEVCIRSEYLREWGSCVDKSWPMIVCSYPDSLVFWSCLNLAECPSVQSLSHVWLFATPWTAAYQASLSITNSWNLLKLMSIKLVMPSNHVILCHPLLLVPSIFPSIRVFSNDSILCIRWPKYWSFSFSISPSNE